MLKPIFAPWVGGIPGEAMPHPSAIHDAREAALLRDQKVQSQ